MRALTGGKKKYRNCGDFGWAHGMSPAAAA